MIQVHADVVLAREIPEGVSHIPGYFHTPPQLVAGGHAFDTDQNMSDLNC